MEDISNNRKNKYASNIAKALFAAKQLKKIVENIGDLWMDVKTIVDRQIQSTNSSVIFISAANKDINNMMGHVKTLSEDNKEDDVVLQLIRNVNENVNVFLKTVLLLQMALNKVHKHVSELIRQYGHIEREAKFSEELFKNRVQEKYITSRKQLKNGQLPSAQYQKVAKKNRSKIYQNGDKCDKTQHLNAAPNTPNTQNINKQVKSKIVFGDGVAIFLLFVLVVYVGCFVFFLCLLPRWSCRK